MENADRLWTRPYLLLMAANLFSWLSYNMVTPILTGYTETLGGSVSVCGIVGGLFAFTSCFCRPVSGFMADHYNRKRMLSWFTLVMAVSQLVYSVIPSIPAVLVFRGIHGIGFGISSTAGLVLVSECVPERRMGEAVSYYGVMSVVTMAAGPGLGIWLSGTAGYRSCMLISSCMLFCAFAATVLFPYRYGRGTQKKREALKRQKTFSAASLVETKLIGLTCVNASFTMLNGVVSAFLVVSMAERGIEGVSWHFTVNAAVLIFSRIAMAKLVNRWSLAKNLYPAYLCGILSLLLISGTRSLTVLVIAGAVKAFAQGMSQPALQTEALRTVPPKRRGVACSTMYIGGDLGQALGPMIGGMIAQNAGYVRMYLFFILPLAATLLYFIFRERKLSSFRR